MGHPKVDSRSDLAHKLLFIHPYFRTNTLARSMEHEFELDHGGSHGDL